MRFRWRYVGLALALVLLLACLWVIQWAQQYSALTGDEETVGLSPDRPDVTYCTMDGIPLTLDLYLPPGASGPRRPAVLYLHGGAWVGGDKRKSAGVQDIPELVRRGYVVASAKYRLAPDYKFPAPLEDAKCAVRYLRARAAEYNLDPDRIGVWGASAGGQLVSMMGLDPAGYNRGEYLEQSSRVAAVADLFGPADLTVTDMNWLQKFLLYRAFGTFDPAAPILKEASPVTYITPNAPPFLILHGEVDALVPPSQSRDFSARLQAAGVTATLVVVKNANHEFNPTAGPISPTRAELTRLLADFFDRHLK